MNHATRIAELTAAFNESMARFLGRLQAATAEQLVKAPEGGGWSAAQVVWHVGATNEAFAGLIDGSIPNARPAAEGFTETPWGDIASQVPAKLEAPERFHPPADVTPADALAKLVASQQRVVDALAGLEESRAGLTVRSTVGTPISLYQVGNWAAAHVARHNSQVKRLLGS
ncbi:MAG: DinB family protein [Acidobacteria bacterium]|nr:DinB family protein [Acidobacteriota bacterium]